MHEWRSCSQRAHAGLCVVAACSAVGRVSVCRNGPWSGCAQQNIIMCVREKLRAQRGAERPSRKLGSLLFFDLSS